MHRGKRILGRNRIFIESKSKKADGGIHLKADPLQELHGNPYVRGWSSAGKIRRP